MPTHRFLLALALAGLLAAMLALAGCPAPKMPTGPPPEYEDPPAPSWLEAGTPAPPAPPSPDAGPLGDG
ncbi:MAG TPA: hypothetical protein VLT33_50915 [Labilithrix sp.]|nr:hypothetical protein [Labilithrix sp.]